MDRFVHNDEFNRDVIYQKLADISSKLEEEQEKSDEERNIARERELVQMPQLMEHWLKRIIQLRVLLT